VTGCQILAVSSTGKRQARGSSCPSKAFQRGGKMKDSAFWFPLFAKLLL